MPNLKNEIDITEAVAGSCKAGTAELQPFAYVSSLQYSLKNFRFELQTTEGDFHDATFFASFVFHSLEIVKFIIFSIAFQMPNATYKPDKDFLASLALFQSKNWFLVSLLTRNLVQVNSKLFLDHISDIEEVLSLWEGFIVKNKIKCFQ